MRRLVAPISRIAGVRFYTPPDDLKKLFNGDFDKGAFPVDLVSNDSVVFAKFLYKAAEAKGTFDTILKDFQTIIAANQNLPIFWERQADCENIAEFKNLSAPTMFTLMWMQKNNALDQIASTRQAFETFTNAQKKKVVATIYVASEGDAAANEAKDVAKKLHADSEMKSFALDYNVVVDRQIVSGFAVDVAGRYYSAAKGAESASSKTGDTVDYTNIASPKLRKTEWEDSIETEALRKYLDQLALYDQEEFKSGV